MIILYTKTGCPWCDNVRDYLLGKGIPFQERNVNQNQEYFNEMLEKSDQTKAPTLDLNGEILADAGVEEVENFLNIHKII